MRGSPADHSEREARKDEGRDEERRGGVCAGGLGRFVADSSCFPTRLEKGGKERIRREEKSGTQDQYAARSRSETRRPKITRA
jgi:hypothetical protein